MIPQTVDAVESVLSGVSAAHVDVVTIEGTVPTGFEQVAKEECAHKLNTQAAISRGRVLFDLPTSQLPGVLQLRSIDTCYILIGMMKSFEFGETTETSISAIKNLMTDLCWEKGLNAWKSVTKFEGDVTIKPVTSDEETSRKQDDVKAALPDTENVPEKKVKLGESDVVESSSQQNITSDDQDDSLHQQTDPTVSENHESVAATNLVSGSKYKEACCDGYPSFRVTCYRTGKHVFSSMEAASAFGAAINDHYNWRVTMKNFDIEVVLNIVNSCCYVGLNLCKQSLHHRNIVDFGRTTLRPTIAYGLLTLACIKPDEVVCDPMCGGGSIPIEGALSFPSVHFLCGDLDEYSVTKLTNNITHVKKCGSAALVDGFLWDATKVPLPNESLDVVVTDLPFGKRSGTRTNNRSLYPEFLKEMARLCKPTTGRAVVLTQDKKTFIKSLQKTDKWWKNSRTLTINIGGLEGKVFIIHRTAEQHSQ